MNSMTIDAEQLRKRIAALSAFAEEAWKSYLTAETELKPMNDRLDQLRHNWCEAHRRVEGLKTVLDDMESEAKTNELCPATVEEKQEIAV